jgi:hypothetical protein
LDGDNNLEIFGSAHGFELLEFTGELEFRGGQHLAVSLIIKLYFSLLDIVREASSRKSKDSSTVEVDVFVGRHRRDNQRD